MNMHVQSTLSNLVQSNNKTSLPAGKAAASENKPATDATYARGKDQLSINDSTDKLRNLGSSIHEQTPVDETKVSRIKALIDSGNYTVNPQRVAAKLLNMEQTLP